MRRVAGRRVAVAATLAVATALVAGCGSSLDRRAVEDAQRDATGAGLVMRQTVERNAGATPETVVGVVEEELADDGRVEWWVRSANGDESATWQFFVTGSAQEAGVVGYESSFANLCAEATVTFATGEVVLTDIDCPEDAGAPADSIDADLAR